MNFYLNKSTSTFSQDFSQTSFNLFNNKLRDVVISDASVLFNGAIISNGELLVSPSIETLIWISASGKVKHIASEHDWSTEKRGNLIFSRIKSISNGYIESINDFLCNDIRGHTLNLAHPFWHYEYGHFFDTFQKISLVNNIEKYDSVLINNTSKVSEFETHLHVLGLSHLNIIEKRPNVLNNFEKLTYIFPIGNTANFTTDSYEFVRAKYYKYFDIVDDKKPDLKIFFTRRPPLTRYLSNYDEIESYLKSRDVLVFDGTESIETIVNSFSRASHVAAIHGSTLANSVFGNKHTKYLEFCPSKRLDVTFVNKYKYQLDYKQMLFDTADDFNIELPLSILNEFYGLI
jgi:hypothetical protein